jgi:hypothetical protein
MFDGRAASVGEQSRPAVRPRLKVQLEEVLTVHRLTRRTLRTRPIGIRSEDDVIPRDHLSDMVTDSFDDAGAFVPENRRKRRGQLPVSARNVGVADADRDNPDEHVGGLEIRQVDLFEDEWTLQAVSDRGCTLHGPLLTRVPSTVLGDVHEQRS